MSSHQDFKSMVRKVRNGDAEAAYELVRSYESDLRILARVKLNDPRLRRVCDSMDVCQSVFGNFFLRASAGQFEIESPEQLMKLLATMIRNKVTDAARRQTAGCRDQTRLAAAPIEDLPLQGHIDTPSQIVATRELCDVARKKFTAEEKAIMQRRKDGMNWDEIARELGGAPDALRKKLSRAVDRVAKELGLEDASLD